MLASPMNPMNTLSEPDLELVRKSMGSLWEKLRGKRIFITGGTGFFGSWLLETLIDADREYQLGVQAVVLTRDPQAFVRRAPHLARASMIQLHTGDISSFVRPAGHFTHVIHAATDVTHLSHADPIKVLDSIVAGTRRVLDLFVRDPEQHPGQSTLESFLYVSSGAAYGPQPPEVAMMSESFAQAPSTTDTSSTYGNSKRLAEHLCCLYEQRSKFPLKIARCFAFLGPYMPFEAHLAAGTFIQSALDGKDIYITGDGTTLRSYLYGADLAIWLWTILLKETHATLYNVGSESAISIRDLAQMTQSILNPSGQVHIAKTLPPGRLPARLVPATDRARSELALAAHVEIDEAIRRTGHWRKRHLELQASPT